MRSLQESTHTGNVVIVHGKHRDERNGAPDPNNLDRTCVPSDATAAAADSRYRRLLCRICCCMLGRARPRGLPGDSGKDIGSFLEIVVDS